MTFYGEIQENNANKDHTTKILVQTFQHLRGSYTKYVDSHAIYQSHQHAHHKSDTQAQINKTYVLPNPHQTTSQIRNVVEYDVPGPTLKHPPSTELQRNKNRKLRLLRE